MNAHDPSSSLLKREQRELASQARRAIEAIEVDEPGWEQARQFPWDAFSQLADHGMTGLTLPSRYGGRDLDRLSAVVAHEQIARRSLTLAEGVQIALNGPAYAIAQLGSPDLASRLLPDVVRGNRLISIAITEEQAGSDLGALQTTFRRTRTGVVVTGSKCFVTAGALADCALVLGRWGGSGLDGLGYVLVDRSLPGVEVERSWRKIGGNSIPEVVLTMRNCEVPAENVVIDQLPGNEGFKQAMNSYNAMRLGIAAMCVGAASGVLDHIVEHLNERQQFGRPLSTLQGLQWRIAGLATRLEQARLLTYAVAAQTDAGNFPSAVGAAQAKLCASEVALELANEAIQLDGWRGIVSEEGRPSELTYRQLRGWTIAGGTSESLLNTIGAAVLRKPDVAR